MSQNLAITKLKEPGDLEFNSQTCPGIIITCLKHTFCSIMHTNLTAETVHYAASARTTGARQHGGHHYWKLE
jgi:hypothetical protein